MFDILSSIFKCKLGNFVNFISVKGQVAHAKHGSFHIRKNSDVFIVVSPLLRHLPENIKKIFRNRNHHFQEKF